MGSPMGKRSQGPRRGRRGPRKPLCKEEEEKEENEEAWNRRIRAGARAAPAEGVWTWGDGLSLHALEVKFILVQEMLDPFQRHTGLQEAVSQP